jgi:EAL domain-containing protein (putative c-di-GMP-specific phosphodiesterase class I)/GGDEF domain-containing protein
MLVVLVGLSETDQRIDLAGELFLGVAVLGITDGATAEQPRSRPRQRLPLPQMEVVSAEQSLELLCWHVVAAVSRIPLYRDAPTRHLGPLLIDLNRQGTIDEACELRERWFFPGAQPRPGGSLLPLLEATDRASFASHLARAVVGEPAFFSVRLLDALGLPHVMYASLNATGPEQISLILQPLIDAAPIVGHRLGTRDPDTGLIDRWELWRRMEADEGRGGTAFVLHAVLDTFAASTAGLGFQQLDEVFARVASAIASLFPWPALPSRLSGGAFLMLVNDMPASRVLVKVERLLRLVQDMKGGAINDSVPISLSVGIARVTTGDHDLAVRLAETAAREAQAAGGNRMVQAGPQTLIRSRLGDLSASLDLDAWEVWVQPVVRSTDRQPEFHEALARFGTGTSPKVSRSDFFTTGQLAGMLARFDQLMIARSLALVAAVPGLHLSVNVTRETFQLDAFPDLYFKALEQAKVGEERVIVEISPACLTLSPKVVVPRLERLAAAGVAVALDDFGSGVCSLSHLTDFPIAIVKLDGIVTAYAADDPLQRNFIRTVVNLGRARGMRTAAEYTRTDEQLQQLVVDGVTLFQGELFGMPRPATDLLASSSDDSPPTRPT